MGCRNRLESVRPELVKLAAKPFSQPLTDAINMWMKPNSFTNNTNVASVVILDKGKSNI